MNKFKALLIVGSLASIAFAKPLAWVNEQAVTMSDVQAVMKSYEKDLTFKTLSKEQQAFMIEQAIEAKLVQQQAIKDKIDESKIYKEALKSIEQRLMTEIWMKKELDSVVVSKEEVQQSYENNINDYEQPFKLKARHIVVQTQQEAQDIINKLNESKNDIQKEFIALANQYSLEPGASKRGGDLGWFKKGDMLEPFWNHAYDLKEKNFSKKPLKTHFGYHVIYLEGKQPPYKLKLEQVYSAIEEKLKMQKFQQHMSEKINTIKKNAKIVLVDDK
jgi:peptidylprolyl isomerase